jgi:hypothetical protein
VGLANPNALLLANAAFDTVMKIGWPEARIALAEAVVYLATSPKSNNSYLGMVRQWQELFYDRRYSFTELANPDFGLIARGNGIAYRCVERREELAGAVAEMKACKGAYLLEVRVESEENVFPMVPAGAPVSAIRLE